MPRKTVAAAGMPLDTIAASMRPRPDAAENPAVSEPRSDVDLVLQ